MGDAPLVVVDKVSKSFGDVKALVEVDLSVDAGEVVVVIGPSGSGKSTLCRCINRLEPIDSGTIVIDGEPLPVEGKALARLRSDVGMVFQSFNLFAHRTVLQNVALGPRMVRGKSKRESEALATRLLERVGVADQARKLPAQLSGGQQQRVAIARALATDPDVMLLDEVTSALDPVLVAEVLDAIRELAAAGMTMVIATHEMGFARDVANRVAFLDEGRILEQGPPDRMFSEPREDATRRFLDRIIAAGRM